MRCVATASKNCWYSFRYASITVTLDGEERLERFERLDRALKADCSWLHAVFGRRLSHNGADE
jgi:hypothetical protein